MLLAAQSATVRRGDEEATGTIGIRLDVPVGPVPERMVLRTSAGKVWEIGRTAPAGVVAVVQVRPHGWGVAARVHATTVPDPGRSALLLGGEPNGCPEVQRHPEAVDDELSLIHI